MEVYRLEMHVGYWCKKYPIDDYDHVTDLGTFSSLEKAERIKKKAIEIVPEYNDGDYYDGHYLFYKIETVKIDEFDLSDFEILSKKEV